MPDERGCSLYTHIYIQQHILLCIHQFSGGKKFMSRKMLPPLYSTIYTRIYCYIHFFLYISSSTIQHFVFIYALKKKKTIKNMLIQSVLLLLYTKVYVVCMLYMFVYFDIYVHNFSFCGRLCVILLCIMYM